MWGIWFLRGAAGGEETCEVSCFRPWFLRGKSSLLIPSLKLTFSPLKMDGWKMSFLLGNPILRGYMLVSGSVLPGHATCCRRWSFVGWKEATSWVQDCNAQVHVKPAFAKTSLEALNSINYRWLFWDAVSENYWRFRRFTPFIPWLPAASLVPSCGPNFAMSKFSVFCLGNSVPWKVSVP